MNETLKNWCRKTDTKESGIEYLVEQYYVKTLGWSKEKAEAYVIELFETGTIGQIKVLGKDGEQI